VRAAELIAVNGGDLGLGGELELCEQPHAVGMSAVYRCLRARFRFEYRQWFGDKRKPGVVGREPHRIVACHSSKVS